MLEFIYLLDVSSQISSYNNSNNSVVGVQDYGIDGFLRVGFGGQGK